ncbi:NUDIX hydrolase [Paenibacillus ginsengarvi]|uniref:NUDIX domain-containing protein n=1 Tax=Paenibacillus ginsengarvi TaxID=400777 RepID=A0A3B0BFT6_9BACL|nr:NUDIX domain-containing protein [Paenibacillus ginsengarvi]RKN71251.1 NUDIX domain-containing protein [Paenibacillus ginsengarvi]
MERVRAITDSDFEGGTPAYMDRVSRYGARGVVIDDQRNVAMMYMSKRGLYKLPGGGLEEGEPAQAAFLREIREETGYEADVIQELGYIEEHKKTNNFMQLSYCYIAKERGKTGSPTLTESESELGMEVRWMPIGQAIEVMKMGMSQCGEKSRLFMLLRDKTILELAKRALDEM